MINTIICTCWWALWKGDPLKLQEDDMPRTWTMRQCAKWFVYNSAPRVPLVCLSTTGRDWWIQLLNPSQYHYLQLYNATFTALSVTHNRDYPCEILSPCSLPCTVNLNMIHSYQLITLEKSESRKELLLKDTFMKISWVLIWQMLINQSTHVSDFFFKFTIPVPLFSGSFFSSVVQIFSRD